MEREFNTARFDSTQKLPEVLILTAFKKEESSIFPCPYCLLAFVTKKELKLHLQVINDNETNDKEIKFVDHASSSCEESENELLGDSKYKCEDCDRNFISIRGLKQHNAKIHGMGKKPYACEYCNKKFKTTYALSAHMKNCNKISQKYQNVKFK